MVKLNSNSEEIISDSKDSSTFIKVLISTFSTIFLAELGDKTQIATLMLSAQSGKPSLIFLGAALALICTSLLGVVIGRWIADNFPRERFTLLAGLLMICLGLYLTGQGTLEFIKFHTINP